MTDSRLTSCHPRDRSATQTLVSFLSFILAITLATAALSAAPQTDDGKQTLPIIPVDNLPAKIDHLKIPIGFEALPEAPADNPTTMEKIKLGRRLFFDPILSTNGTVSCASCHQPDHGFSSPDAIAVGIDGKMGTRNSPSILNRQFGKHFTWDGREPSLESQIMGPLTSEVEMGGDLDIILVNLNKDPSYVSQFVSVFGEDDSDSKPSVSIDNVAKAIACFERTLTVGNSQVDRFRNSEYDAMSKSARQGMWIFESRGGCWKCHSGNNLSDEKFHNTGVSFGSEGRDIGRMTATDDAAHNFQFKTPSLRHVEHSAPYMHDGSQKTLRDVVEFYNRGGAPDDTGLAEEIKPLNLSDEEVGFLVDFLKALSGDGPKAQK